ncbi:MAG: DUF167 family protein [Thermomicrobiales bacterium]
MTCDEIVASSLAPRQDGCVISLTVSPRSSTNRFELTEDGTLRVRLTAPPVEGAANAALLKLLANVLGTSRGRLTVVSGATNRHKRVAVDGMAPIDVAAALCRDIPPAR